MNVPNSKQWEGSLIAHTVNCDWNFNSGGVVRFFDGTVWAVSCEAQVFSQLAYGAYGGFTILELKPGSQIWEALTPDSWGSIGGTSPNWSYVPGDAGFLASGPMTGNLSDFRFDGTHSWRPLHSGEEGDNIVYLTNEFGYGPLAVNKETRTWERFYTTSSVWDSMTSNPVLDGDSIWFMAVPAYTGQGEGYSGLGARLVHVSVSDLGNATVVKQWLNGYSSGKWWYEVDDVSKEDVFDLIDNQFSFGGHERALAVDDGWVYYFERGTIEDGRTTGSVGSNSPSDKNYDVEWSALRRCQIGVWEWEVIYWHRSPDDWVGVGGFGTSKGSWGWATIGATTYEEGVHDGFQNSRQMIGGGFKIKPQHDMRVRDGWLYFINNANQGYNAAQVRGYGDEFCRIDLDLLSEPVRHNILAPLFETISNGTHPTESYQGNIGDKGSHIEWREGSAPLYGRYDVGWMFDDAGDILFQHMTRPTYYMSNMPGWGVKTVSKLSDPKNTTIDVTVSFTGTSLKGYSNARQLPTSPSSRKIVLS